MQMQLSSGVSSRQPPVQRQQWRPGKAVDMAMSPDGRWLAVSFGDSVRLYGAAALAAPLAASPSDNLTSAEVQLPRPPAARLALHGYHLHVQPSIVQSTCVGCCKRARVVACRWPG